MMTDVEHPDTEQLLAFGHGMLAPDKQAVLEEHIAVCDHCCSALEQLPDDPLLATMRRADTEQFATSTQGLTAEPAPAVIPPDDVPPELASHERLTVIRKLGSGGMGVVYLAEDRLMDRLVAVKLLDHRYLDHEQAGKRFAKEVQAAGRLSHRNIVTAYDATQIGKSPALIMEYVEGTSLDRVVAARGPLPVAEACDYARQTALGLAHAHQQGWVHRDIKPQNLMATPAGQIKILDFGLARLAYGHDKTDATAASLTARGAVLGTPDYIAPEQARDSKQIDHRVDIYSLGCTLYFMLAGKPPFVEGSSTEKMANHMMIEPPSLANLRPDLPKPVTDLVQQMMRKKPEERMGEATGVAKRLDAIAAELQQIAAGMTTSPEGALPTIVVDQKPKAIVTRGRSSRRAWIASVGGVALLAAAAGGAAWLSGAFSDPPYTGPPRVLIVAPSNPYGKDYNELSGSIKYCKLNPLVTVATTAMAPTNEWLQADMLLSEVDPDQFDSLFVLGPLGPVDQSDLITEDRHRRHLARVAREMLQDGKPVAGHAIGTAALAEAGILQGRKVADCPDIPSHTKQTSGAEWLNRRVVADGNLFTSQSGNDHVALLKASLDGERE